MPTVLLALASVYALVSLATLAAFGIDKRRAQLGARRIPERTLHFMELAGGWPGALIGMQLFRHKRRKARYFLVTAGIALAHAGAWIAWLLRG
jgi:uncharacterized membrane protein YsdA (DUF1294 family)